MIITDLETLISFQRQNNLHGRLPLIVSINKIKGETVK